MADEKEILLKIEVDRTQSQKELEATTKQILDSKAAINELNKSFKAGEISTDQYVKQSINLKKTQKELTDQQKALTKEVSAESNSLDALRLKLSALTKERNGLNQQTKEGAARFKELQKEILDTTTAIKDQEQAGGDFRRNVGNYGSVFKEAVGGVQVFGQSLGSLFKMILTNPIGLIITALVALFNILKQNDTIATFFKGVMTGLGVVMDQISAVVSDVVLGLGKFGGETSKLTEIIKDVGTRILNQLLAPLNFLIDIMPAVSAAFEGEFSKAADIAGEASKEFGKSIVFLNDEVPEFINNMSDAVKVGIEYEKALDAIEAKQSKLNVTIAKLSNERDKLILQSKDLSKTEEERIALNEKAVNIDRKILKERLGLLDEEINAQKKYISALGEDSVKREEAEFKLNDLQVQRLGFQNEAIRFEEIAQNKRNAIIEKQLADEAKLAEEKEKQRLKDEADAVKRVEQIINSENKLEQFRLDQAAKNAESIDERLRAELEAEDFRVEVLLEKENLLASEREFILADSAARIDAIHKKSEENQRAETEKTAKIDAQIQNQKLGLAEGVAGTLASIAKDGSDTQKVLASVAAAINTAQGVTGALANSAPPPVGLGPVGAFVSAATIGASGLAQIAKINAAAGGGDFITTKPTLLLVGDNPGGRERISVTPLSGRGKTTVHKESGMIAMAGGGSITTGASLTGGMSNPIAADSIQSSLLSAFQNMPAPVVSVKEVTSLSSRVRVKETIKNL
jgi:hypothetical protein